MSYQAKIKKIAGNKNKKIFLFTLSTCIWCKKTKKLLSDLGLEYSFVDVDLLSGKDLNEAEKEIEKYNSQISFPTIVVDNGQKVILGFQEAEIKKLIN